MIGMISKKHNESQKDTNQSIYNIIYIFMGLFLLLIIYFIIFLTVKSDEVINNTYNKRQGVLAERIIRGDILSADGDVLARTVMDEEGVESREYPYGEIFAHVVGRASKGMSGIEQTENIRLLTSDINTFEKMFHELSNIKSPGNHVITTLDSNLSQIAYDALGDNRGAVVVMEPSTGKILVMVSKPSYDPNRIDELWEGFMNDEGDDSPLLNRATQGLYSPGSTFKVLTALAFMREYPDYIDYDYRCEGHIEHQGMVIHCSNKKVHGEVDLTESLAKSCNSSFAHIATMLDLDSFYSLNEDFNFNKSLPVSIISNPSSYTLRKANSSIKEAMQTAIGQGKTLITPLHNAMIISTIANGGVMMKPYVVDRIENAEGERIKKYTPQIAAKPMTAYEAHYISEMLRQVVTDGTATNLKNLEVEAAGKTGSAENMGKKAHAWFIGFAPADQPEIAISVIVENVGSGNTHAVPIARKVFDAYFDNKK